MIDATRLRGLMVEVARTSVAPASAKRSAIARPMPFAPTGDHAARPAGQAPQLGQRTSAHVGYCHVPPSARSPDSRISVPCHEMARETGVLQPIAHKPLNWIDSFLHRGVIKNRLIAEHGKEVNVQLPIDDEHAPLYAVRQVADMLGVQPAFLRPVGSRKSRAASTVRGRPAPLQPFRNLRVHGCGRWRVKACHLPEFGRILELEFEVAGLKDQLAADTGRTREHRMNDIALPAAGREKW